MNKPWYKSKTAWGSLLVGGGMILTSTGRLLLGETDASTALIAVFTGIGIILVAVGLRDAIGKN